VLWQHVMLCCGAVARCASYDAHLATAPQHIRTQQDMLPQHIVCKYGLNCEHRNITLARNKAPWWWSDKIEACRSVLKCFEMFLKYFMWNYMCIRWLINWSYYTYLLVYRRHLDRTIKTNMANVKHTQTFIIKVSFSRVKLLADRVT